MDRILTKLMCTLIVALSCVLCSSALAEEDCMDTAKTDEAINVCQHKQAKQYEFQLIELVRQITARFKGEQLTRFKQAQTGWEQMMNKDCEVEANFFEYIFSCTLLSFNLELGAARLA